jgi:TetR/AcrR family tetracycline transcriptional repressor
MGRPKEPLIEVNRVVEVALEIIDETGLDGLNMRLLGRRLGVNSASLYHHFHNKDDILQAVREYIVRKAKVPARLANKPWDEQLMILGKAYRAGMANHPNAVLLVTATNPMRSRSTLGYGHYDCVIGAMLQAGFTDEQALMLMVGVEILASGSIMEEFSLGSHARFGTVDAVQFPNLYQVTDTKPLKISSSFPQLLTMLIEGAQAQLPAKPGGRRTAKK